MSYSIKIAQLNEAADQGLLGVRLGRLCISTNTPVNEVAHKLDVSKSVVYKWFTGKNDVGKHLRQKVESYIVSLPAAHS
jgi:hypothetical protein